jgi:hypothetical protein
VQRTENAYEGLSVPTAAEVGRINTGTTVPTSGKIMLSNAAAAKSWCRSSWKVASRNPPIRVLLVEPKAVVSSESTLMSKLHEAALPLRSLESMVML